MKSIKYLLIILASAVTVACDREVNLVLPAAPNILVVEARLELVKGSSHDRQVIKLSKLGNYFDNVQTPRVSDALVSVRDDKGRFYEFTSSADSPGIYYADNLPIERDVTYTLTIRWNGQEFTASEKLVSAPKIDTIYQIFEEENQFEDAGIKVAIDFTDPASEQNYYFWELFANGENSIIPDPGNSQNIVASDKLFNGKTVMGYLPSEEKVFNPGDVALVRQIGISKRYFNFMYHLFEQTGQT